MTLWLVVANVLIFLGDTFFFQSRINAWGAFTVESGLLSGRIWELITFQFLHASFGHVGFNCLAIWWFGPFVERWWGAKRFIAFYLLCGVAGALFFSLLSSIGLIPNSSIYTPLVGASAGIYGIVMGIYFIAPDVRVRIYFLFEMSMQRAAMLLIGIAVAMIVGSLVLGWGIFANAGGEAGHLGGALLGFLFMKNPGWLGKRDGEDYGKILHPDAFKKKRRPEPKLRPRSEFTHAEASEVDRVLDKINRDGFESLTAEDREILNRASGPKSQ